VILLEEVMTDAEKITLELLKLLVSWDFIFIDVIGRFGGNITGWKKYHFTFTNLGYFTIGPGTSIFSLHIGKQTTLLNIYGPYLDRVKYWDKIFKMDSIHIGLVVVRGI
jgi:hypothetical protein